VLPAERRKVGKQMIGDVLALPQNGHGALHPVQYALPVIPLANLLATHRNPNQYG
jgi:hypothetical protein